MVAGQGMTCADADWWRGKMTSLLTRNANALCWRHLRANMASHGLDLVCGMRGAPGGTDSVWQVLVEHGGAWGACSTRREPLAACVCACEAGSGGWVLLRIVWSINLWPWFNDLMGEHTGSKGCSGCGLKVVTHFWQWLLDEGKGNRRTSEMTIGTRKSKQWLWYHVKNIKWDRERLNSLYIDVYFV